MKRSTPMITAILTALVIVVGSVIPVAAQSVPSFDIYASPTAMVPFRVAVQEGFLDGIANVNVVTTGFGEDDTFFIANPNAPFGAFAPEETANYVAEGEKIKFFSTSTGIRFINSVVVRADSDIQSVEDLIGRRVGNPGFGTGTWQAFEVVLSTIGISPREDFNNIVASAGALLGLLERGEIDAALLLSGQTVSARANPNFRAIFAFDTFWEERTGQPLLITGLEIRTPWFEQNRELAREINAAFDRAVLWMQRNSHEFGPGGKYERLAEEAGWMSSEEGNRLVREAIRDGRYFVTSGLYTDAWIDAVWQFAEAGVGIIIDKLPNKEDVFISPSEL